MMAITTRWYAARTSVTAVLSAAMMTAATAQVTERVSLDSSDNQGNNASAYPSISADGRYVAFLSVASNLVPGDTNLQTDIFVRDCLSGATERVSLDSSDTEGNGLSYSPSISADGRYIAFHSVATNLVLGDTNGAEDVFVRDRLTGATERVSVNSFGAEGNSPSLEPSISGDGRFVAFYSLASNLVAGDTNNRLDVFVRDRQVGVTERVSLDSSGAQGNGDSGFASISVDGRYVAFESLAVNLVPADTNLTSDIFVRDRLNSATERVSLDSSGAQGNSSSVGKPSITADGRYVAFRSIASNLVSGDTNSSFDVFVRDRQNSATERVSLDSSGMQGNDRSLFAAISADGRFVAFHSLASNLVAGDTNNRLDVFVRDRQVGATERASLDSSGAQGSGDSLFPSISADGRCVAFYSIATNLVPGDTNGTNDVFVRDRLSGVTAFCFGDGSTIPCPCANNGGVGRGCSNSLFATGALLSGAGTTSVSSDTLLLSASGVTGSVAVFFQGASEFLPAVVDDGLGCVGGPIIRLGTKSVSSNASSFPQASDPQISVRGAVPAGGAVRWYQCFYRNATATFCPPATSNRTNGVTVGWIP